MSRRVSLAGLILVVAIWVGVLLTPQLRLLLAAQIQPLPGWMYQLFPPRETSVNELAKQHPNDPRILAAQIEDLRFGDLNEDYRKKQLREYDALIEKFPREEWVIQNRLRLSMSGGFAIDTGKMQAQSKRDTHSWLSSTELLQALKIAERGARLYPQNSFYDWMRAILLFTLKREQAALVALQQGARKSQYDDGILRDMQIRDEVRAMQSPQLWEERVSTASGTLLLHYEPMRRANRAAVWRGAIAERSGNHQRALEIYGAQMSLSRLMWRDSSVLIGTLFAQGMMAEALNAPPHRMVIKSTSPSSMSFLERLAKIAGNFARYARTYGRSDLAQAALDNLQNFKADEKKRQSFFEESGFGVAYDVLRPMLALQWTNSLLVQAVLWSTLGWLALNLALLGVLLRVKQIRTSALDIASSVAFVIVPSLLPFLLIYLAVFYAPAKENIWGFMLPMQPEALSNSSNALFPIINLYFGVLPFALSCFYCGLVMLWRGRRSAPVCAEDNTELPRAAHILVFMAFVIFMIAFAVSWWEWLAAQHMVDVVVAVGTTVPFLTGWIIFRMGRRSLQKRSSHDVVYGFAWCRSTLGALAVISSIAYFVCALLALPVRREANAGMDNYITRGETAFMREAVSPR